MPKTKLWSNPAQDLAAVTKKVIKRGMAEKDINQKELAKITGMAESTISYKLRNGTWTQDDLRKLIAVLPISMEDAAVMAGYRRK